MLKGWDPASENFNLQIRHPKLIMHTLTGRPRALVVDIVEDLRAGLGLHGICRLSTLN